MCLVFDEMKIKEDLVYDKHNTGTHPLPKYMDPLGSLRPIEGKRRSSYAPLVSDLEECGLTVNYVTLELGTLGHFTSESSNYFFLAKSKTKHLLLPLSKTAISISSRLAPLHLYMLPLSIH